MLYQSTGSRSLGYAICAIAILTLFIVTGPMRSQSPVGPIEFTAEVLESSKAPLAGRVLQKHLYFATRGDSSTATGSLSDDNEVRQIKIYPSHLDIRVSDKRGVKTTHNYSFLPLPASPKQRSCGPSDSRPANVNYVGEEEYLGYKAVHYRSTPRVTGDGFTITTDYWMLPAVNCFEAREYAEKKNSAAVTTGIFERKAVRIQLGPPPTSYFEVSPTYREVLPSELDKQVRVGLMGPDEAARSISANDERIYAERDQRYQEVNSKANQAATSAQH